MCPAGRRIGNLLYVPLLSACAYQEGVSLEVLAEFADPLTLSRALICRLTSEPYQAAHPLPSLRSFGFPRPPGEPSADFLCLDGRDGVTAPPWLRALHVEHLNSDNQPLPLWNPVRVRFHGLELIPTSSSVSMWSCSLI